MTGGRGRSRTVSRPPASWTGLDWRRQQSPRDRSPRRSARWPQPFPVRCRRYRWSPCSAVPRRPTRSPASTPGAGTSASPCSFVRESWLRLIAVARFFWKWDPSRRCWRRPVSVWANLERADACAWLPSLCRDRPPWDTLLTSLAALYVRGAAVDWAGFDRDYARRRVGAPTYPFQHKRYWVERPSDAAVSVGRGPRSQQGAHPLLGRRVISPALKEAVFESEVGLESLPILDDHRFCDIPVLPGAFQLAMFVEAASRLGIPAGCAIEGVSFAKAMASPPGTARTAQVIVSDPEGSYRAVQLVSRASDVAEGDGWTVHSTGRISSSPAATSPAPARGSARGTSGSWPGPERVVSREEFYGAMREHRAHLGASFQAIETAWAGQGEVLCRTPGPGGTGTGATRALFTRCSWTRACKLLVASSRIPPSTPCCPPPSSDSASCSVLGRNTWWCYLRRRPRSDLRGRADRGCLALRTGRAGHRHVRRSAAGRDSARSPASGIGCGRDRLGLSTRLGASAKPTGAARRQPAGPWLILADQGGVGTRLATLLEDQGERCVVVRAGDRLHCDEHGLCRVDPGNPDHFRQLLEFTSGMSAAGCHGVVNLWGLDQPADAHRLADFRCSCASTLYLLQALEQGGLHQRLEVLSGDAGESGRRRVQPSAERLASATLGTRPHRRPRIP